MSEPAKKKATYEDLYTIPENMTGEIINGELVVTPRPSRKHGFAATVLSTEIVTPYQFGRGGGPGGWIFIVEPEIGLEENILVPDIAGWKRERFPRAEAHNWISVAPDWICEVLSPHTARYDRIGKMRIYIRHRVPYVWLVDPILLTLEAYNIEPDGRIILSSFAGNEKVRMEPFPELELDLGLFWLEE
jgi:Uma2 family endonuclease